MLSFLTAFLPGRTTLIAIGVALVIGLSGGYWIRAKIADAERLKAIKETIAQYEEIRTVDLEVLADNAGKQDKIKEVIYLKKEIPIYVPVEVNGSCNLTRGAVWLLNSARSGVPNASALTDGEKQAPSTITQRAEVDAHFDCAIQYNELAADHDSLIDWINKTRRDK